MQLHVESVQGGFPDCIALQRVGGKERRIRIEFEFRSSSFRAHGHPADECDWIVCWEHDWPDAPSHLRIIELREYFDRGFNVWVDVGQPQEAWPFRGIHNFGKRVTKGDLVFCYEAWPRKWFQQVYVVGATATIHEGRNGADSTIRNNYRYTGDPAFGTPGYRHAHNMRRLCVLDPPLEIKTLEARNLAVIPEAIFSQKHNRRITEHWWMLFELLCKKYPDLSSVLGDFSPTRV